MHGLIALRNSLADGGDAMPSATFNNRGASVAQPARVAVIKATSRIENEVAYQMALATWGTQCEKAVEDSVNGYIDSTCLGPK